MQETPLKLQGEKQPRETSYKSLCWVLSPEHTEWPFILQSQGRKTCWKPQCICLESARHSSEVRMILTNSPGKRGSLHPALLRLSLVRAFITTAGKKPGQEPLKILCIKNLCDKTVRFVGVPKTFLNSHFLANFHVLEINTAEHIREWLGLFGSSFVL